MGHHVICLDIDKDKIEGLKKGIVPIYEPGLEKLVKKNKENKRLTFTTDYKWAVSEADVIFICVPSPCHEDGSCNTSYIENASKEIAKNMTSSKLIVNKSTAPIGICEKIEKIVRENLRNPNITFDVVSNPEFLKEGTAIKDCLYPDRVILGVANPNINNRLDSIYQNFELEKNQIIYMDRRSAEMTKYAANCMLATRISFINEMARLCELFGADITEVKKGIGADPRIGPYFLNAGVGYGGSCFPKDVKALLAYAKQHGYQPEILKATEKINNEQKVIFSEKLLKLYNYDLKDKIIAIWGLSFKPETDDLRNAPSLSLIKNLLDLGASVKVYDPISLNHAKEHLDGTRVTFCNNVYQTSEDADAICLMTEWKEFLEIDYQKVLSAIRGIAIFDGRNVLNKDELSSLGFDYNGIGVSKEKSF